MSPRIASLLTLWLLPAFALAQTATPTAGRTASTLPPPTPDFGGNLLQMLLGLALVLALFVGGLWLLKQLTQNRGDGGGLMRVVAGTAVGTRERVVIVEVGSTWLVLGVAPGRVSPLAEIPRQALPPGSERRLASAEFPAWLARLTGAARPPR